MAKIEKCFDIGKLKRRLNYLEARILHYNKELSEIQKKLGIKQPINPSRCDIPYVTPQLTDSDLTDWSGLS
jgi:hypothetical protein